MKKLNCLIGDIISGFVRTEFTLSQILTELGFRNDRIDFFADSRTEKKLKDIREEFDKSNLYNKHEFIALIDELDELREQRNIVVHSLVLTEIGNHDNHMFHNYQKFKTGILNKSRQFRISDLVQLKEDLVRVHNCFYELHFGKH